MLDGMAQRQPHLRNANLICATLTASAQHLLTAVSMPSISRKTMNGICTHQTEERDERHCLPRNACGCH